MNGEGRTTASSALMGMFASFAMLLIDISTTEAIVRESCMTDADDLEIRCGVDEVIMMHSATYGRMHENHCVTSKYGPLGCSVDVLHLLDQWCSGETSCTVAVRNKELADANQCPKKTLTYLEVDYICAKGVQADAQECEKNEFIRATGLSGILPSLTTDQTGCGSLEVPWKIHGAPGQIIDVAIVDFGAGKPSNGHMPRCEPYGFIFEPRLGTNISICRDHSRERDVFTSSTNEISVQLVSSSQRAHSDRFLIKYKVLGCPDAKPPENAWYKRDGDTAVIGCNGRKTSWHLTCNENTWEGAVGNCTMPETHEAPTEAIHFPISPFLSLIIIICLAALIVVLLVAIGFGYCRYRRQSPGYNEVPMNTYTRHTTHKTLEPPMYAKPNKDTLRGNTVARTPSQGTQPSQQGTLTSQNPDLLNMWDKTVPEQPPGQQPQGQGQQINTESDYLVPCNTGTIDSQRKSGIYEPVVTADAVAGDNSAPGDDYWVAGSEFEYYGPENRT